MSSYDTSPTAAGAGPAGAGGPGPGGPAPGGPAPAAGRRPTPAGWVVLTILGVLISLAALAPLAGGGFLLWANATQRDADGFFATGFERFETTTYALTSERIDLGAQPGRGDAPVRLDDLATVRIDVRGDGPAPVFVGIAPGVDVERYLAGVRHAQVEQLRLRPYSVSYRYVDGGAPTVRPGEAGIWTASVEGRGLQRLIWAPEAGDWAVVVMNADGSPGVSVSASLGARADWVAGLGIGLVAAGLLGVLVGAVLLVVGVLGLARGSHLALTAEDDGRGAPVRLEGRLDEPLNRGLWLVKWLLLIPHLLVLIALWLAFAVVTVVAFFAILVTERYPKALFEFNVGVLRWSWRVGYYGASALATDRYPPFSLGPEPDYPATLTIRYPERLSRGLVLVKWWLLAIPHYLVLGLIGGGLAIAFDNDPVRYAYPLGGLLGMLVAFAAVALLFTGRYPQGLFGLVMGLNRWVYRVIAYVALMRDEYPPFRLDQGGSEPEPGPTPPVPPPPAAAETGAGALGETGAAPQPGEVPTPV